MINIPLYSKHLVDTITYDKKLSPWSSLQEANNHSLTSCLVWNLKVHYSDHKSMQLVSVSWSTKSSPHPPTLFLEDLYKYSSPTPSLICRCEYTVHAQIMKLPCSFSSLLFLSPSCPNILLSILFSSTLYLKSSITVTAQVTHPYRITELQGCMF